MKIGNKKFDLENNTYIMGILNVTPDSFSDGGQYTTIQNAISHAKKMIEEGAAIIDIGGESTRPGHESVSVQEEINRVVPVIEELIQHIDVPISIDTSKAAVAEAAIKAGASLINDVWGFKAEPEIARVAAQYNVPCCLMHNRDNKDYQHLIEDMKKDLAESISIALEAGVKKENIILDPGIGFAKTVEDNLVVMNHLEEFFDLGYPVLLGTSRKSMIGKILDLPVEQRVEGTVATTVIGIMKGCSIIRVHDVKENLRAAVMTEAIMKSDR
ncbi:dihydropteroate synthase [Vallitalea okinawensis]|uniref:dihydropteroate synthase n=1 Tax=Vallitalea okinawensis TaxID=2078660 RepID=UPI000CFE0EA6|nr:dihydropteroate synthase [Vallitalea okinawensis]